MRIFRQGFVLAAAAGIALASAWTVQPVHAEKAVFSAAEGPNVQDETAREHHRGGMSREDFEAYRLKRLQEMAVYFGITTEGKSAEQLKKELETAKETNKDKWEAFKAEHHAKRLEHLREIAEKHGIETEGKTAEQLRDELMKVHGGKEKHRWKEKGWHKQEQDNGASKPESSSPEASPAPAKQP